MKIIFVFSKAITFNTFLQSQANYFIKKGLKVKTACLDTKNLNFKKNLKYKIDFPSKIIEFFDFFRYVKVFTQIKKIVKKNPSSIFYLHTPVASHIFRLYTFFYKLKIIYFVHGFRFTSKTNLLKSIFFKAIEKILSLKTDIFITINKEDYNFAKFNLFKQVPCYKINGVGLDLPHTDKKKIKKKKGIKKILVIAAYKKEKGYLDLLKVAEIIKNQKIKIECYGYGNKSNYLAIKKEKKLSNIKFNSFNINLKYKIKEFDLLLHLSKREGLPVSVMQSLAEGLPVICYNIRGNNDLIKDKYNGYFVKTYEDVLFKIKYLNSNEKLLYKMRINAIKSINNKFSKKKINLKLYRILINYFKQPQ